MIYALQNLHEGKTEAAKGMGDRRILIPLPSSCSGKVDESSFYISPYELNANSISDIKTFKSSYQSFFHRQV